MPKLWKGVVDGNTRYYLMFENSDAIYEVELADFVGIVRYDVGDKITLEYLEGAETMQVIGIVE